LKFLTVQSTDEALEALARFGSNATLLAGGTDVMIQLERCEIETEMLLHLERLDVLREIVRNRLVDHPPCACD
jgi:CO/xanthine dehydrogenase FAD-binding subunit